MKPKEVISFAELDYPDGIKFKTPRKMALIAVIRRLHNKGGKESNQEYDDGEEESSVNPVNEGNLDPVNQGFINAVNERNLDSVNQGNLNS